MLKEHYALPGKFVLVCINIFKVYACCNNTGLDLNYISISMMKALVLFFCVKRNSTLTTECVIYKDFGPSGY